MLETPFFVSKDKHAILKRGHDIVIYDCISGHRDIWPEIAVRDLYCMDCLNPLTTNNHTDGRLLTIRCVKCDHKFYPRP